MEATQVYAVVVGGIACAFLFVTLVASLAHFRAYIFRQLAKYLLYLCVLNRHALIGPWSAADVLLQVVYLTANILCLSFGVAGLSQAGLRAGTLSLINLGPLFSGPHLDFLADLLGVSLKTYRLVHRSAGLVAFALATFHVLVVAATQKSIFQTEYLHPFVIIAASAFFLLMILSRHLFQRPSYEIFLRTHQALAVLYFYSLWRHVPTKEAFPRVYLYIFAALFGLTFMLEVAIVFHRNGVLYQSRTAITHSCGTVKLSVHVSRPLKVEPGQYVNLWMPSVSFWAFLQSHPFVVTSWADTPQNTLSLFVQPRRGFTGELLRHARQAKRPKGRWVMFSGPHGRSLPVGEYEKVVLVADSAGIAAQLPYLKRLIHGYHARQIFTRRIHLIWQISDIDVGIAAEPFLNEALDEDKLENGGILQISIYVDGDDISKVSFGRRTTVYPGMANLQRILEEEIINHPGDIRELQSKWGSNTTFNGQASREQPIGEGDRKRGLEKTQGKMLISVSGFAETRDSLRTLVRKHLEEKLELVELDFQPFRK